VFASLKTVLLCFRKLFLVYYTAKHRKKKYYILNNPTNMNKKLTAAVSAAKNSLKNPIRFFRKKIIPNKKIRHFTL